MADKYFVILPGEIDVLQDVPYLTYITAVTNPARGISSSGTKIFCFDNARLIFTGGLGTPYIEEHTK